MTALQQILRSRGRLAQALLCCVLLVALTGTLRAETSEPPALAWELSPYKVQLYVHVDPSAALPAETASNLAKRLTERLESTIGGAWRVSAAVAPADVAARMSSDASKLSLRDLPKAAQDADKVTLLSVQAADAGWRVEARELDTATGLWNTPAAQTVRQTTLLETAAAQAVQDAFAPLARIESIEADKVIVKLRAGSIPRRDGRSSDLSARTVLVPVLRQRAQWQRSAALAWTGEPQPIDWAYLLPQSREAANVTCRLHSAATSPLPEFHPLRERLALAITAPRAPTRIHLKAAGDAGPLVGYDVLANSGDEAPPRWLGRSDQNGLVVVPAGDSPLLLISIEHGRAVLARRPLTPGWPAEVSLQLPNDTERYAAELILARQQTRFLELASRAALLQAQLASPAAKVDAAAAKKIKAELSALPKPETLRGELGDLQRKLSPTNEAARKQVAEMFVECQGQIASYEALRDEAKSAPAPVAPKPPLPKVPEAVKPEPVTGADPAKPTAP